MITEELTDCPKCGYKKALTHWSNDNFINWIACPKCRIFFDHGKEGNCVEESKSFWEHVDHDTGFKKRRFEGETYEEIKENVKSYLEKPPMTALPGGSWCYFCNKELCRDSSKHSNRQFLQIAINKLMNDLADERTD